MFSNDHQLATVTVILPSKTAHQVARELTTEQGEQLLKWPARGTLLHDHWLKKWVPPISPTKQMLQMIVPNSQVDHIVNTVVDVGKLNYQATGAVFATPHDHAYLGSGFHIWPGEETQPGNSAKLNRSLTVLYCIVSHGVSDRISKAAINSGAHGPVVHYCEGRGLRDRLGWLRITKEHEKEVLMVICDEDDCEEVFDAMVKAGELHLPGRGFMFRLSIDKGMFNLPSRVAHHHYDASMQQVINAIDHLQGHTHWRDKSVFDVGGQGRGAGVDSLLASQPVLDDQMCLTAVVPSNDMQVLVDLLLDSGAPGLNFNLARSNDNQRSDVQPSINNEYAVIRSITDSAVAQKICTSVDEHAEQKGLTNLCMTVNAVPRVATYVPGKIDYRAAS